MNQEKNIGFSFLSVAEKNPALLALVTDSVALNYAQLAAITRSFASQMQSVGIGRRSIVVLDTQDVVVAVASALATALLGARWISKRSQLVLSGFLEPTHFFQSPEMPRLEAYSLIDNSWFTRKADIEFLGYAAPDAPWLYVSTSGTTGKAKSIEIGQGITHERSLVVSDDYIARKTVFCCLFNCVAFPFLTRAFASLLNGCTLVYGTDQNLWRRAGVNLVMGSPKQARELFAGKSISPKIREIHLAGARLDEPLTLDLLHSFERVVDLYASTETNRSYKNVKSLSANGSLVTHGLPLDSIVQIVDAQGQICGQGIEGVVRVKNDYLVTGYMNNPEAEALSFRDGWFYPGDRGKWADNGELVILGRTDDVINLGGVKINGAEIDAVLQSAAGVSEAICFKSPLVGEADILIAFVVIEPGFDPRESLHNVEDACLAALTARQVPARIIEIDSLPKAQKGGAQRWKCQSIYAEKEAKA